MRPAASLPRLARAANIVLIGVFALAANAAAQEWWQRWGGGYGRVPPRFATPGSFDGAFNWCRVMYTSGRGEAGGSGWRTDYPDADINFSIRLSELTKTHVSRLKSGEPNHLVVRLTEEALFECPFISMEDAGTAALSEDEVARLRTYLLKGGFLWADDFWGTRAWESWVAQIGRVLPPGEYPIRDVGTTHPIFRTMFEVEALPQIPSIQFWRQSGGLTSERGQESAEPSIRAISDRRGRIMVLMTHNTDIADAWEREGEDPRFFYSFSPQGYAVGINVMMYAMSH
jgi:hypothetical protein